MDFLKRIKDGASRVSEKAQSSVEVGKLNSQISDVEREMELEFMKMGKIFFDGYRSKDMSAAEGPMVELARGCLKLQDRIGELRLRIAEIKNERICTCGAVVPLDANFCPACGAKLEAFAPKRESSAPPVVAGVFYGDERDEDEFYGADELTDEEKELALRHDPSVQVQAKAFSAGEPEVPAYAGAAAESEHRRREEQLERERQRQLELDRRIRDWHAVEQEEEPAETAAVGREMVKCQICRADLPKGSMWCSRCGSEQI
ncbi:zinc ribbon domain-containing protein [Paenibacillus sp. NFR01]|uniref:zinc ribbon domain-containing protein n=1 Tax=Paenibacillus sp. NFR01 TaxID=1566279 RepID=UPI0008B13C6B|nr:zinc ribbon domain-containing protein [Paenibacillus sp. NFR01]SEU29777.1 hypothetical protein SAMN03159358_4832 [Paenibacillus sp. NFR01]